MPLQDVTQNTVLNRPESSGSSYSSDKSTNAKPFRQRIAELVSLRITSGAFYFCDMGKSPLIRLVVDSAKVRYRYGATSCPVDESRKRFRVRLSGLCVSVADRQTVSKIMEPISRPEPPPENEQLDNTDRLIKRMMEMGYKGINDPFNYEENTTPTSALRKRRPVSSIDVDEKENPPESLPEPRASFRYKNRSHAWEARRPQPLPCLDILTSETAVVDYVFDEPGPLSQRENSAPLSGNLEALSEGNTEDTNTYPAPVCRVSVLLRGATCSYDMKAVADIERVLERLQPAFYDLMPLAMKSQSQDGKRSATGIQIEVDATPVAPDPSRGGDTTGNKPLISIPFDPRDRTWTTLVGLDVRKWPKLNEKDSSASSKGEGVLPSSAVDIYATHLSIRTEIPYRTGAHQKTTVSVRTVNAVVTGVVEMPLCYAKNVEISRTLLYPQKWNDVHFSSVDVILKNSEIIFLPDSVRVVDDLAAYMRDNRKKPADVRYFIPFKETTRIRVENKYNVVLSCSHDNIWDDIHALKADEYGKMRVCGETGELLLTPGVATEFLTDAYILSWSLSLPNAIGQLVLPFPHKLTDNRGQHKENNSQPSDTERAGHNKARAPSLAQRVRSQLETFASHHHHTGTESIKPRERTQNLSIVQAGDTFELTGKAVTNEVRKHVGFSIPVFLDAVDSSDINLKASSLSIDVNPHHFTHYLNVIRNYAGNGTHVLSKEEKQGLYAKRNDVAQMVLNERRYPFMKECMILGLSAGQTLSSIDERGAMDELLSMTFHIDSLVVRLHDLPHALSPFNRHSKRVCSIESGRFHGSLKSNRLGQELVCSPELEDKALTVYWEHRDVTTKDRNSQMGSRAGHLTSPTLTIEQFEVRKRTMASPEWGPYMSELTISIGRLTGCVQDSDIVCISRIGFAAVPEPLLEDQLAAFTLLTVENIEVVLGTADILVLSTSSHASAERSGQESKRSLLRHESIRNRTMKASTPPTFLTGVSQVKTPFGLRFLMSNLASETVAIQSRLLVPEISLELLMSWGGKLTPWVDEATLRAQVAHAMLVKDGSPQGTFQDGGFMRRAGEVQKTTVEFVLDFRPRIWSQAVARLQTRHVSQQNEKLRGETPCWYLPARPAKQYGSLTEYVPAQEVHQNWWEYLQNSRRASILKKHFQKDSGHGRLDSLSIGIFSDACITFSPESLELANDVVIRCKEEFWGQQATVEPHPSNVPSTEEIGISPTELTQIWNLYEAARPPRWSLPGRVKSGVLLRGVQTEGLRVMFMSPSLPGDVQTNDPHTIPRAGDGDVVHLSAPLGLHVLDVEETEVPVPKSIGALVPSHVRHTRTGHVSVPGLNVGCNSETLCQVAGIVVILRGQTKITWVNESEVPEPNVRSRDEKYSLVSKIASIVLGRENSRLEHYARFGRIASIFTLMSRALALESASLSEIKNVRMEQLLAVLTPISIPDLMSMGPRYARTFFSDTIERLLDDEVDFGEKEKVSSFVDDMPHFMKEKAENEVSGAVSSGIVTSIDIAIRESSLRLADEEIIKADLVACKGGSTAKAQKSSALEGHVLSISFGIISIAVRDDIAANSLRMVSEVASFVRRATISMPMLRYDGESSKRDGSTIPMSYSFMNEQHLKSGDTSSLRRRATVQDHRQKIHSPLRNHGHAATAQKSRAHWYNISRAKFRRPVHAGSLDTHSQPSSLSHLDVRVPRRFQQDQLVSHKLTATPGVRFATVVPPQRSIGISEAPAYHTTQRAKTVTFDKRRERPGSLEKDPATFGAEGRFNRENVFAENDQYFTYVGIPTAGESGPPRKRSKAMVRLAPVIPPSFSNVNIMVDTSSSPEKENISVLLHHREPSTSDVRRNLSLEKRGNGQIRSASISGMGELKPEREENISARPVLLRPKKRTALTLFVSCHEIVTRYFRRKSLPISISDDFRREADICFALCHPRLTLMSEPSKGSHSLVVTVSSARLKSANNPNCELTGSIARVGVTLSIAQRFIPLSLPKLIASARISEFQTTLHATDLKSVLMFREEFKSDLKAVLSAFVTTKSSISEMARATRLSTSKLVYPVRTMYSTISFDLLCETSRVNLEGFHPRDSEMCISYLLDGLFFSVVASEADKAALTLGLRLYGHGLSLSSPSWSSDELFHFPNFDARGVQWGETTGLPTLLKVSAEPLTNRTSVQSLRHVLFTVAGLMAFQHTAIDLADLNDTYPIDMTLPKNSDVGDNPAGIESHPQIGGATPFTRSFAAWERTKGVRMDLSIRPMSIILESGEVVARFDVEAITGICEWNKLVRSGVQLHAGISIPKISLVFMRMPVSGMTALSDTSRASLSVSLEKSRLDVLKTQEDLTHTFTFRLNIFAVSGQLRPWKLLLDAAAWADEQEFVSDLQAINTAALSSSKPRTPKSPKALESAKSLQHRIVLVGANVQRFKLAVPLLSSELYSSSRLALRATELHFHARERFDGDESPRKNIFEVRTHFIGILWENSALLSSHHSRITLRLEPSSGLSTAHFGAVQLIVVAGTWRICPRKDVLMAILEAKNGKENRRATEKPKDFLGSFPEVLSKASGSVAADSFSNTTERQGNRLLVESLQLKILRTSGFIEGLDGNSASTGASTNPIASDASKLTVPAFSVAMVRERHLLFDLIDIDFSGREGEFPPQCLEKVSKLFAELFGAVASNQPNNRPEVPVSAPPNHREMSRDTSVLVRFGKSLYRAQEEAGTLVESKFSFFAGATSSILVSLSTKPVFGEEMGHTTVITGISPKLALEVTPLIEGTNVQGLRLIDARLLHGFSPSRPPHTLLHIAKVTALLDAKTLLLTQGHINAMKVIKGPEHEPEYGLKAAEVLAVEEQSVMVVLGRPRSVSNTDGTVGQPPSRELRPEPDIRMQLKLPPKNDSPNEVDIFAERVHVDVCRIRSDPLAHAVPLNVHIGLHDLNLRAQWDIVNCKLRLRENLFSCGLSGTSPKNGGTGAIANIMNRLQFESTQYGNHTMKLGIDAIAAVCVVPSRGIVVESTTINAEFSHTMVKSVIRLTGQWKKLAGEVKLLVDREISKRSKRAQAQLYSAEGSSRDMYGKEVIFKQETLHVPDMKRLTFESGNRASQMNGVSSGIKKLQRSGKATKLYIKGDGLTAVLRGYQFEETQHSAMVSFTRYNVSYEYNCILSKNSVHIKELGIDFSSMKMSYSDDERSIHSDLFTVPSPKLKLKVVDTDKELTVELVGDLEVRLGPGFFLWSDFKKLSELTINGITAGQDEDDEEEAVVATEDRPEVWDGRVAQVSVRLNPRIDVIGDLTADMLQAIDSERDHVTIVPKNLYDNVLVHLEAVSEAICDPLCR